MVRRLSRWPLGSQRVVLHELRVARLGLGLRIRIRLRLRISDDLGREHPPLHKGSFCSQDTQHDHGTDGEEQQHESEVGFGS